MYKRTIVIGFLLLATFAHGQPDNSLDLMPPANPVISDIFELFVSEKDWNRIRKSSGKKIYTSNPVLFYNGDSLDVNSIKTRGKSSLTFQRKSLSVSLHNATSINEVEIKRFALLALPMDKNYWRNRLSFLLMSQIGIFPLDNMFAEFRINGLTQGVYLFVRKTEDYIRKIDSPLLIRQVVENKYEIDYEKGDMGKAPFKEFQKIRSITEKYHGKELADALNEILDLKQYMQWLAFNYLVMNGDYADEVFYYYNQETGIFNIIPWDYDDVFSSQPHEGWNQRNITLEHSLIYSGEAYLDRVIDKDEYLFEKYLIELKSLIYNLDPLILKKAFEQVYSELHPFYSSTDIISQSATDASGLTNFNYLEKDLNDHYNFLLQRYRLILNTIEK